MKTVLLLLAFSSTVAGQEMREVSEEEANRHQVITDAHPERWRDDSWFMLGSGGDRSMAEYDRTYPNARKGGPPPWVVEKDKEVARFHQSLTGRPYVASHKRTPQNWKPYSQDELQRANAIIEKANRPKVANRESEIQALRDEVKRLLARLEALESADR